MLGIMYSFKQIVQFYLELYFNYNKNLLVSLFGFDRIYLYKG